MSAAESRRGDVDLAPLGAALADPARSRMLLALDDGRALPASALAAEAGVRPSTASAHLAKLVAAGLLRVERSGRHRYFTLAGPHVGELIEVLTRLAPARPVRTLRDDASARALREARTCYDHLAGRLGVALMGTLVDRGHVSGPGLDLEYELTEPGHTFLSELGVALPPRRRTVRHCVDWSERRHHLAGGVGRGLLDRFFAAGWILRAHKGRAVLVTEAGRAALHSHFGLTWSDRQDA